MRKTRRWGIVVAGLASFSHATPSTISFSTQAEAFTEAVSIDAFTSGWHDELHPGDHAALHARTEIRANNGPWHVAWRWRYDYQIKFAPGTAELYHRIQNDRPVDVGRPYPLSIEIYHLERHGPTLGYSFGADPFEVELSLNLYQGITLTDGRIDGHAVFASTQAAGDQVRDLLAGIDYRYSEPQLQEEDLNWQPPPPDGWGYGIDVSANWRLPNGARLALEAQDLLGEMRWKQVPGTTLRARCDCTVPSYDVSGGLYLRNTWHQRLKPWLQLSALQPLTPDWDLGVRLLHDTWLTASQLGLQRQQGQHQVGLWYEPAFSAWRLSYENSNLRLSWTTDNLDTSEAYRLGVDLNLLWRW